MKCEYCNHKVNTHVALCSKCGRFGRTISQYIRYHEIDLPEITDLNWSEKISAFKDSKNPIHLRLFEMLKEI